MRIKLHFKDCQSNSRIKSWSVNDVGQFGELLELGTTIVLDGKRFDIIGYEPCLDPKEQWDRIIKIWPH